MGFDLQQSRNLGMISLFLLFGGVTNVLFLSVAIGALMCVSR